MPNTHRLTILLILGTLLAVCATPSIAASPRDSYFRGEACYKKLSNDPAKQKYRHNWVKCIENFQDVYRQDPEGSWAAAGLYMTGRLYAELYRFSGRASDRKEAVDHYRRIVSRFPNSKYVARAKKAIGGVEDRSVGRKAAPAPTADTDAKQRFIRAEACYSKLRGRPQRQKYRDGWLPCIEQFESVHRQDPEGPWAAAGLYMAGTLYYELFKWSRNEADREKALERLDTVVQKYPQSAYSGKARAAAFEIGGDGAATVAYADTAADPPPESRPTSGQAAEPTTGPAVVTGLRFWSNPNYTRLVIDADRETGFEYHLLKKDPSIHKPQRLYVDLHNSRLGKGLEKIIPINDDLLKHARAGQYSPGSVRVVVDIKSLESYDVFSLKEPFRIVMDLKGGDGSSEPAPGRESGRMVAKIDPKTTTSDIARQLALGVRRIVIDPGHGGKDYGAPGYIKGVHEKHITLQVAKRLAAKIKKDLKCEVILTRTGDRYLTLEERTAFANTKNADLFISIHTNASRDHRAYGISTYFLNLADDDEAKQVAAMENATSTNNISDLEKILFSLMHYSKINESSRLATTIQDALTGHLERKGWSRIKSKGVKQAPFYVLLGAQMPSILVETSFISNPRECRRLTDPQYQERLSEGILYGVKQYIKDTNPTAFRKDDPAGGSQS